MVASLQPPPTQRPELADIVRTHGHEPGPLIPFQQRALQAIADCRTPALGGRLHACEQCGETFALYNSCRNRHCPRCQTLKQLRWLEARKADLLPVPYFHLTFTFPEVLNPFFLHHPRTSLKAGTVGVPDGDGPGRLKRASHHNWVIDIRPPFGKPEHVLRYLADYTQRIAISNQRLLRFRQGRVTFRYKDRARHNRNRTMELAAAEFLRRFVRHVLPPGFVRLRHYGLLANAVRARTLDHCRQLLAAPPPADTATESWVALLLRLTGTDPTRCPTCGHGHLVHIADLPRIPHPRWSFRGRATCLRYPPVTVS